MATEHFEKGNKERTRRRILEVASQHMRSQGIAASGLAGIMSSAGLTNGAFYAHFPSKEALVRETIIDTVAERRETLSREQALEAAVRDYLNMEHMDSTANGCPSATMLPEIARQPLAARQAYEDGLQEYVSELARLIPGTRQEAPATALAVFGLMVGTLQIARSVVDRDLAAKMLERGIRAALRLAAGPA